MLVLGENNPIPHLHGNGLPASLVCGDGHWSLASWTWLDIRLVNRLISRLVRFEPNVGQTRDFFRLDFSTFWLSDPKMY